MAASKSFMSQVQETLAGLGAVRFRRMFGGAGVYWDGVMFGLIDEDVLYFKVDDTTRGRFKADGMGPFTYMTRHGPGSLTSYWRVPDRLFDEPEEMLEWAREAAGVARRAAAGKSPRAKTRPTRTGP